MVYTYKTSGTCSSLIEIDIENGIINNVKYTGGCNGNLQGVSKLVKGMRIDDVIEKLEGIRCGLKVTSCPDQLARALKQYKAQL
ncbi:MAG: TIGR03905 family TSCPD domain-containing protein [Clostridia bacterium]|nr:TIGR03905 family TSCPD domain-containing protein [Clostridia bacterium]